MPGRELFADPCQQPIFTSDGLVDYPQVYTMGLQYKFVNLGKEPGLTKLARLNKLRMRWTTF